MVNFCSGCARPKIDVRSTKSISSWPRKRLDRAGALNPVVAMGDFGRLGYRMSGQEMISGHQLEPDPGLLAFADSAGDLGPQRIVKSDQSAKLKAALVLLPKPAEGAGPVSFPGCAALRLAIASTRTPAAASCALAASATSRSPCSSRQ